MIFAKTDQWSKYKFYASKNQQIIVKQRVETESEESDNLQVCLK